MKIPNDMENNIAESELHDITLGISGGFFIYHADGDEELIYANNDILHLFGCDTIEEFRQLTGNSFKGIVHPDDLDRVEKSITRQIEASQRRFDYVEYRIIRKDGEIRWVEDFGHLVHSESKGDIFYVFLSDATEKMKRLHDEHISQRESLEEVQTRERQYLRAIISDAIAIFEFNLSLDQMSGRAVQFVEGREISLLEEVGLSAPCSYSEFIHRWGEQKIIGSNAEFFKHCDRKYLLKCFENGIYEPWYDYWTLDCVGNRVFVHESLVLTQDKKTGMIMALAVLKDYTEQALKQEENVRQIELIQALSADYSNVYWVNLSKDTALAYRMSGKITSQFGNQFQQGSYSGNIHTYIENAVYEQDRDFLRKESDAAHLLKVIEKENSYTINYRTLRGGVIEYFQMRIARVASNNDDIEVVIGFTNVDKEIRHEMEQRKQVEDALEIISGLSSEYDFICLIDPESSNMSIYKLPEESNEAARTLVDNETYRDAVNAYGAYVVDEDREAWFESTTLENIIEKLKNRMIYSVTIRVRTKSRSEYVQFSFTKVSSVEKEFQLVLAKRIVTNVVERELSQQALLRRYETLFVSAASDIYVNLMRVELESRDTMRLDTEDGRFMRTPLGKWDDYLEEILPAIAKEDRDYARSMLQSSALDAMKDGEKRVCNYRGGELNKEGHHKYYSAIIRVHEEEGQRLCTIFTIDNTSTMERESQQKQLLEDALAQAQHANVAKTTFLSNMSHDMRTPMNAIIGFSSIAASHIDNKERVKDCLEKILSSSNHLLSLINDILDMSRIESGKVQIQEKECNLSELLHSLVNIVQPQVKAKQMEFFVDTLDIQNENIIADPLKLNQIFINILGNAVKFTPAGGIVSFRIRQLPGESKGFGSYEFVIKDTGIGMSQEFVEHIFEPFEREQTTTKNGIEGTGLGMAITKNIVDMMGGTIKVNSVKGKGTEFVVHLDIKLQEDKDVDYRIQELKGLRALVADDDFETCNSVTKMLEQIGMRSEWTTSSKEAVFRAKKAHDDQDAFHTYILDLQMPGQDGIETARKIRKVVGNDIPIIILTAYDWSDVEEEAREAGITAFCSKPLFMSDLKSVLLKANNLMGESAEVHRKPVMDFGGKRVLVVEDNELNREIAEEILTEAGLIIEVAVDGTDAVQMVETSKPGYYDAVLMDIQMPIMDGYEATMAIRGLDREDAMSIPIIAMTANAFEEDKALALKCGMNDHVAKPLNIEKLFEILAGYLKG